MNERIRELADQASESISYRIDPHTLKHIDDPYGKHVRVEFNKEKFAELIVKECAEVARDTDLEDVEGGDSEVLRAAKRQILEHFGIE